MTTTSSTVKSPSAEPSLLGQCVSSPNMRLTGPPTAAAASSNSPSSFTSVQLNENARFIRLSVQLPGVLRQDLGVELQRGVLTIRGMRETQLSSHPGLCSQHTFMRRFAMDTDVVDGTKLKANLNRQDGVLTIMAPKKSLPKQTLAIVVTEQNDEQFHKSVLESYYYCNESSSGGDDSLMESSARQAQQAEDSPQEQDSSKEDAASVGSTSSDPPTRTSPENKGISVRKTRSQARRHHHHKSTLQSHLMIRRSQASKRSN